jgi:hypothetical protein
MGLLEKRARPRKILFAQRTIEGVAKRENCTLKSLLQPVLAEEGQRQMA